MNDLDRFDRFTERARKVLRLAEEEAQRFQHNYVGTEHLLLGLVREGEGIGAKVLVNLGVELDKVRSAVEFIIGRGERIVMGVGLTPRAKKVIQLAVDEARRFNHHYIGTEHLLLGLVRESEGIAAGVLTDLGVSLEKAWTQTALILQQTSTASEFPIAPSQPSVEQEAAAPITEKSSGPLHNGEKKKWAYDDIGKFDKFTERARKVLSLAQEEAEHFQHNYIGTEHLLLGLVREGEGVGVKVLANLGVELDKVRSTVEFIIGHGNRIVLGAGLTPRTKKVIELAVDEARRLKHHYVGTEHLLLGLVREGEGIAAGVLTDLGVNLDKARTQTALILQQTSTATESPIVPSLPSMSQEAAALVPEEHSGPLGDEEEKRQTHDIGKNVREFDQLTEQASRVLAYAQEEAKHFQHNYIGTEHLLLGLVREGEGVAAKVLANFGVELNKVRSAVEAIIGRGDRIVLGKIGLTPRAKKVIKLAGDEAFGLKHGYIGTEHLLLGLLREGEGIAIKVLESLGVNREKVREQTLLQLNQGSTD